jgi:hypothetical protein
MPDKSQLVFAQSDVDFMEAFGKFLVQKAKMELTIPEAIQLNKHLAQYNRITKLIDAHVMELQKIVHSDASSEAK